MTALKGAGLLKGLGVTLKTMSRPAATRQYPHVRPDLPARTRGVIALIEENCTVCMLCSRECPDWCIYIDSHKEVVAPKEGGRARTRNILDRFAIDYALCMYCGICVEVCPFDALHWSPEFEYAEYARDPLTHEMDRLREWAYTVPVPDPLEEGAVEPREFEAVRKAQEAAQAKAAAQAQAAATPAPSAPAAAGAPAVAPSAATAAPAQAAAPASAAAAPEAEEVHVEPGIDQETFDRLVAGGEPERTARAKAKAAYMRKAKAAPAAPAAAGTPEAAEPAPNARAPEARSPEGEPTASGTAAASQEPEHLEIEIDQSTYDKLIAAGESDRTARARAKAAYARKLRAAARGEQ